MDRRGENVPNILAESEALAGRHPEYQVVVYARLDSERIRYSAECFTAGR
jgi:hypothetical protein